MTKQRRTTPAARRASDAYAARTVAAGGRFVEVVLSRRAAGHVDVMMASGEFDSMSGLVCAALGYMRAAAERVIEVQQLTDQAKLALGELKAGAEGTVTDADIISLAVRYMLEQVNRGFRIELPVVDSGDEETPPCPSS